MLQPVNRRAFHVQRPLVCAALCFGVGIAIGGLWQDPLTLLPWLGLGAALLALLLQRWAGKSLLWPACFLLLFAGMLLVIRAAHPVLPPPGQYEVSARVEGQSEVRVPDGRTKVILRDVRLTDAEGNEHQLNGAYLTYYPGLQDVLPQDGQRLRFLSRLYWPSPQRNPYGFDFRLYLLQKGIPAGLSGAKGMLMEPAVQAGPSSPWLRARLWVAEHLDQLLYTEAPLLKALLIGQRAELPDELRDDFQRTGIAHVLSVSGLHVGILVLVLRQLFKWLKLSPRMQFGLLFLLLLAYCRLLDFAAPVLRASVLALFLSFGLLVHRRSDPLTGLSAAFMVILIFRPLDLFHVGFQLSFLAVLGIFTLGDRLNAAWLRFRERRHVSPRWMDKAVYAAVATLSATLFTAPLVMRSFHYFSPVGLLFSPLVCLVIGVAMWYGLALLPLSLLSFSAAQFLAWPLRKGISLLLLLTEWTASLSFATIRTAAPPVLLILGVLTILLLLSRYSRLRRRWRAIVMLAVLLPSIGFAVAKQEDGVRYMQLSLGNADAAVIEDGAETYLIDAGEQGSELASYLLSRGRSVDGLYITHLHFDHIGGLEELMRLRVPIRKIYLPFGALEAKVDNGCLDLLDAAKRRGIAVETLAKGDGLQGRRLSMRVLWPVRDQLYPGMDPNHGSLVTRWELDGVSLLATGDLTRQYERYAAEPAQLLKVAHHGSRGSSSQAFLDIVQPQIALLSASEMQLPRMGDLLARLESMGCESHSTAFSGALSLLCRDGQLRIDPYLKGVQP